MVTKFFLTISLFLGCQVADASGGNSDGVQTSSAPAKIRAYYTPDPCVKKAEKHNFVSVHYNLSFVESEDEDEIPEIVDSSRKPGREPLDYALASVTEEWAIRAFGYGVAGMCVGEVLLRNIFHRLGYADLSHAQFAITEKENISATRCME
jgi:hypothetical protein